MVGRDLPNLCPHGEDHQGRRGAGEGGSGSGSRNFGTSLAWRSSTATIQIHKALV